MTHKQTDDIVVYPTMFGFVLRRIIPIAFFTAMQQSPGQMTFQVSAEVVEGCAISGSTSQSGIDFGTLDFGSHPSTASGQVSAVASHGLGTFQLTCSPGTELSLSVDGGQHSESQVRNLKHATGSQKVAYQLYLDSNHGTPLLPSMPVVIPVPESGQLAIPIYGSLTLSGAALPSGINW
jgi:spore coat protein U-like protein